MSSGYGGWGRAGNIRASGKSLVRNKGRAFGFGRKDYTITGSHLGLQSEFHLFAADIEPVKTIEKSRKRRKSQIKYLWSEAISFYPRAMLLAGETLFIAGPSDIHDFSAHNPKEEIWLWAVSTKDGAKQDEYKLKASPVYDSFAACRDNLYFTTVDGWVVCYQPEK
jgi:hypothetical protein